MKRRCTCVPRQPRSNDIDPPEGLMRDQNCPIHGRDPDVERDKRQDKEFADE